MPQGSLQVRCRLPSHVSGCHDIESVTNGSIDWLPAVEQGLVVDEATAATVCERGNTAYRVALHGLDAVDFLLAAGPAEPLRPLAAVASGGESARIMLALKAAPAVAAASVAAGSQSSDSAGAVASLPECSQACTQSHPCELQPEFLSTSAGERARAVPSEVE